MLYLISQTQYDIKMSYKEESTD